MANGLPQNIGARVWPQYTLTGFLGLLGGLVSAFVSMSFATQSRVQMLEAEVAVMKQSMHRMETKLDTMIDAMLAARLPHVDPPKKD